MCGIMGVVCYGPKLTLHQLNCVGDLSKNLLIESQRRGSDASGMCWLTRDKKAMMFKDNVPARVFVNRTEFTRIANAEISYRENIRAIIGHTRAQTKGTHRDNYNNHPIVAGSVVGVHNGMISNDDQLFSAYSDMVKRAGEVDSEIIFRLIDHYSQFYDLEGATQKASEELTGSFSCAFIHLKRPNYLTLFGGRVPSIYLMDFKLHHAMVFASTKQIINDARKNNIVFREPTDAFDFSSNDGVRINLETGGIHKFKTNETPADPQEDKVKKVEDIFKSHMAGGPTPHLTTVNSGPSHN